jgi:hypothetical protein
VVHVAALDIFILFIPAQGDFDSRSNTFIQFSLSLSLANLRRTGKQIEESGLVPQLVVTGYPFLAASATCVWTFLIG